MAEQRQNEEAFKKAMKFYEDSRGAHEEFVEKVEQRYKTYRGVLDIASDAAQWVSKAHPPYIMHIVETSLASMIEDKLRFRVRPRPSMAALVDPEAGDRLRDGAKAHQILFDWQTRQDKFTEKQRPFILQNSIAGLSVVKNYWVKREERRRQLVVEQEPLLGPNGVPLLGMDGQPITVPKMVQKTGTEVVYDGPTTEVRDVRDFIWTPNATSLSTCPKVLDRVWKTPDELWRGFREGGPFGPSRGGWSEDDCRDILSTSEDAANETLPHRENDLFNIDRSKGLVEVMEVWDREAKTVTVVANRSVLLAHRESFPFFHEDFPFIVASTQPDLFRIPGISQVEKIAHIQTLLWDIQNQSLDNLRLINNAIFWFRPDVEDPDAYDFYPGARWPVEDPQQINSWSPNPIPAEVSLGREALLKGDMQNLAGGFPFSSGADSQFVDQKTATGASLVSNIAQRGLDLQKQQLYAAWEAIGNQRLVLNQQFIREPQVAPVLGIDSQEQLEVIWPELLAGDFEFQLEAVPDAAMKQEEQASAQALLQIVLAAFPVVTAAAQAGAATPLNLDEFIKDTLSAFGKEDPDRYFASKTPAALPPQGGGGMGMAPPGSPQQNPVGVTAANPNNPAVSPSSEGTLSPIAHLQQAMALDRS